MSALAQAPLLDVRQLSLELPVAGELRRVLHDVTFSLAPGQAVGLVGESGSGKSLTARSIIRLLPPGAVVQGEVRFDDRLLDACSTRELRQLRARDVAMVFQDPRAHINPVRRIGDFLCEAVVSTAGVGRREARARALAALDEVGISSPQARLRQYPHELSGGMLQRVLIAAALMAEPRLLLADEPTTALDVTTQSEVMGLVDELRRERGLSLLLVTHDLGLASAMCDRIAVMYAGSIVEERPADAIVDRPEHPYTHALLRSRPSIEGRRRRLDAIPGRPLSGFEAPPGCAFSTRCAHRAEICAARPPLRPLHDGAARCLRLGALDQTPTPEEIR